MHGNRQRRGALRTIGAIAALVGLAGCIYEPLPMPPPAAAGPPPAYGYAAPGYYAPGYYSAPGYYYYPEPIFGSIALGFGGWHRRWR